MKVMLMILGTQYMRSMGFLILQKHKVYWKQYLQVPILGFKNFIMGYQKSTYEYIGTQMDGQNGRKLLYWI